MEGWAIATCEVILLLGAAVVGWRIPDFWSVPRRLWLPALLVAVLIVIGLVQMAPLPASLWKEAGSDRYTRYTEGAEAERLLHTDAYRRDPFGVGADRSLPPEPYQPLTPPLPRWIPTSFTPAATARAIFALVAGLCLILLLEKLADDGRSQLRRLSWLVGGLGFFVAVVALFQHQDQTRTAILWIRHSPRAPQAFGPFVNPNHGAAFVNLAFPLLYYLLWQHSRGTHRRGDRLGLRLLCVSLFAIHITVLVVNHSQAAFFSLALYPVLLFSASTGVPPRPRFLLPATVAYAALLLGLGFFGWRTGLLTDHGRIRLDGNVPLTHFLIGNGLGSFDEKFPSVLADQPVNAPVHNTHLENEYLQIFFEAGLLPALLAAGLGGMIFFLGWQFLLGRSAAFWVAPALLGETFHAAFDFTAHVFPIVGTFLLVTLLGMTSMEVEHEMEGRRKAGVRRHEPEGGTRAP
jgi:hypothetical protein